MYAYKSFMPQMHGTQIREECTSCFSKLLITQSVTEIRHVKQKQILETNQCGDSSAALSPTSLWRLPTNSLVG